MTSSSQLIEKAVEAFASLPGIGRKTALRLVLHLLKQEPGVTERFTRALLDMRMNIFQCRICHNLSDEETCRICSDPRRDHTIICVVESIRDLMAIEDTGQYRGSYHVLGGVISPMEGIGPDQLNISSLIKRIAESEIKEVIMAISPTIEGETTIFYLSQQLAPYGVLISTIARGVAFGGQLEYTDEITLARSILGRLPYSR
ncbi:MAG: recombination mediator RecR [Saprospiraceae bacterium]|nr:recombination mediator RecR [Saprospiraceae bacterium]MDW8484836.1 recombination mediator RecR [Saprospiraceae bacterium]